MDEMENVCFTMTTIIILVSNFKWNYEVNVHLVLVLLGSFHDRY